MHGMPNSEFAYLRAMARNLCRPRRICDSCWKFLQKYVTAITGPTYGKHAFQKDYRCVVVSAVDGGADC